VHWRGLVGRRLDVVAKCGGQRRFVAGRDLHGIDQRRPQVARADAQELCERAHFCGQLLGLAAGIVVGLPLRLEV
jgi:hypothetical protein